jgi:hypothetical protein
MPEEDSLEESAKQFVNSLRKLIRISIRSAERILEEAPPRVSQSIESSLSDLEKTTALLLNRVDATTAKEQIQLLRMYRKVLEGQLTLIDERLKKLEKENGSDMPGGH